MKSRARALTATAILISSIALARASDPKLETRREMADAGANFLVTASYECSSFRKDLSIFGEGLIAAKAVLLEGGYSDKESDEEVLKQKILIERALIRPFKGQAACAALSKYPLRTGM